MRIERIILYNFGSYEGKIDFKTHIDDNSNIILVGGKNGAGKTTLFTAMRICLYGYMSMGYKSQNAYYTRAITKMINNSAKITKPTDAYVEMTITISNGREPDSYKLMRSWVLDTTLSEVFTVEKNGAKLSVEEIADFEKFLLSLIPPELFNLYFFDGEKIADFFMNEGSNSRIKDAFLTLCGYDTFDIMRRNFKRVSTGNTVSNDSLETYWVSKETVQKEKEKLEALFCKLNELVDELETIESEIQSIDKSYTVSGGVSQAEWNDKLIALKEEEKKRDVWNSVLKKWANDIIPFLMIKKQICSVKKQITLENNQQKFKNFSEILDTPELKALVGSSYSDIKKLAFKKYGSSCSNILGLSFEQCVTLLSQINAILDFDSARIAKYQSAIKKSIAQSARIREELDKSSVSSVHEYMDRKAELLNKKSELLNLKAQAEQDVMQQREIVTAAEAELAKAQAHLESDLKKESINDISAKAIVMLDKLQNVLYMQQIAKIEQNFRVAIGTLMRKTHFIDDIRIDQDFNIYLYRCEDVKKSLLVNSITSNSEDQLQTVLGAEAVKELQKLAGGTSKMEMLAYCNKDNSDSIRLPIRVDQTSLSNGEKQIFIMALYYSLVKLGRHEIPFIIDTPFARIDTEHRFNISKHFFSKLSGQVFILSTNEEINSKHVQILKDKIAATYILENPDNKRTVVVQNAYFEV